MFEIYEVPNDELDGTEELLEEVNNDKTKALEIARDYRNSTCIQNSVWLVQVSDENGYEKVIST